MADTGKAEQSDADLAMIKQASDIAIEFAKAYAAFGKWAPALSIAIVAWAKVLDEHGPDKDKVKALAEPVAASLMKQISEGKVEPEEGGGDEVGDQGAEEPGNGNVGP